MRFWRTLGYVLRRLGREVLIWGTVLLVLYLLATVFFHFRAERNRAAWATRYAEVFPPDTTTMDACPAQADLAARSYTELTAAAGLDGVTLSDINAALEVFNTTIQISGADGIDNGVVYNLNLGGAPDPYIGFIDATAPTLDAAADCTDFGWDRDDPAQAKLQFDQSYALLNTLLGLTLELSEADDATRCTETLLRVGRLIPKMRNPEPTWRFVHQMDLGRHWISAAHYARIHDTLLPEATADLIAVVADIHAAQAHPISAQRPEAFGWDVISSRMSPGERRFQRVIRPYIDYRIAQITDNDRRLAAAALEPRTANRFALYKEVWETGQPIVEFGGSHLRQVMGGLERYEVFLAECEIFALMLQLEDHRRAHGSYPTDLEAIDAYVPPGFDPTHYSHADLVYKRAQGGMAYTVTRSRFNHHLPPSASTASYRATHRSWRHEYGAKQP